MGRRAECKKNGEDPDAAANLAKSMAQMTVVEEAEEEKKEEEPEVIGEDGEVVQKKEEVEGEVLEKPVEKPKVASSAGFESLKLVQVASAPKKTTKTRRR